MLVQDLYFFLLCNPKEYIRAILNINSILEVLKLEVFYLFLSYLRYLTLKF